MAKQPESRLQKKIRKALGNQYGERIFMFKVHGGPFQSAGLPDIIGCIDGRFFGMEVKMPGKVPTPLQYEKLRAIRVSGGIAGWVDSVEEAMEMMDHELNHDDEPWQDLD